MRQTAKLLRDRASDYARTMALEMGKPLRDGSPKRRSAQRHAISMEHAAHFLAREPVATEACSSFVTFNLLGVVLAVMPWNFPFWQVFRFAAPTLMAGNAPCSNTRRTCRRARWRSKRCSTKPDSRRTCSAR